MVLPLKPAKFYGSSLPRPRFYVKPDGERVDPLPSVLDPLMSWAADAHWSMGGLSFNRLRLQGKIEGNLKNLRKEREKKIQNSSPISQSKRNERNQVDSPPPAPISKKRRQRVRMVDEDEDEYVDEDWSEEIEIESEKEVKRNDCGLRKKKRRLVRKLGDDFDLMGSENGRSPLKDLSNGDGLDGVALRTRSRRCMVLMDEEEGNDGGNKSMGKKGGVENGKTKKKTISMSASPPRSVSKKGRGKGLGSPKGSRSSPRLK